MNVEVLADEEEIARRGAAFLAARILRAAYERDRVMVALSGGRSPRLMLRHLVEHELPWERIDWWQVDERLAPLGSPDRNLTLLEEALMAAARPRGSRLYAMPVDEEDLIAAAARYGELLREMVGVVPVFDVVHLGLGDDGHTASLFAGDPALAVDSADVAVTGTHRGFARMTLTLPILNRARCTMWLVSGQDKAASLIRVFRADPTIPAGMVRADRAFVFADVDAAGALRAPWRMGDY